MALQVLEMAVIRVEELTPRGLGNVVPWLRHSVRYHGVSPVGGKCASCY